MRIGKSTVILAGAALHIAWLVALAVSVVVYRRCERWLAGRCPWDPWQNRAPC